MSSKPTESQDLKLGPGWTSLSKGTPHPPASSTPSATAPSPPASAAAPRRVYTKAELLELYEPGSTATIPSTMSEYPGITSTEPLVPVNIAPDDDTAHVSSLAENSVATASEPSPPRPRFQPPPAPRPGVEAILRRDAPPSSHAPNAPNATAAESSASTASSTGGSKKSGHVTSSSRDFWSGSAVLAAAERPNPSGSVSERRPLALKPRSAVDRAGSPNGHPNEKSSSSQPSQPYWSRSSARSGADSNANWRGGIGTGGAKYPGSSLDELSSAGNPSSSIATSSQTAPARKSSSDMSSHFAHGSGLGSTSRSGFSREGGLFGRNNKEALKPTNTRDLTVLAKGSSRESSSTSNAAHHDREPRDSRQHISADSQSRTATETSTDNQTAWFYQDPKGNTQGPFTASQLIQWEREGYYDAELPVSKSADGEFKPLAIAFGMRKEEPTATPPPGFNGATAPKKDMSSPPSPMSMRPSREERSRRGVRTVEDMAEEVEKLRLENRNKRNVQKSGVPEADDSSVGKEKSFFDNEVSKSNDTNGHMSLKESVEETGSEASVAAVPASVARVEDSGPATRKSTIASKTGNEVHKPEPPVKQSRFAAFMKQEDSAESRATVHNTVTSVTNELVGARDLQAEPHPKAPAMEVSRLSAEKENSKRAESHAPTSTAEQSTAWNTMVMGMQRQQHNNDQQQHEQQGQQTQQQHSTPNPISAVPVSTSEVDLMAIDPAITHASIAQASLSRPATDRPSSALSPRAVASSEVPSWLPYSSGNDSSNALTTRDPIHENRQRMQTQTSIQVPLTPHVASQEQAQLRAQVQARAQAEAHARAEAYRQAQVQAQVQARHIQVQSQVQQAQAVRVAAQQPSTVVQGQVQPQSQDAVWLLKQRVAQLQISFDAHYRANMDLTRTAQAAQNALSSNPLGSVDYERARLVLRQTQTAMKEHNMHMDHIKYAATTTHAHIVQHQNAAAAAREQQHRQIQVQVSHASPESHGTVSPHSVTRSNAQSPTQVAGNGPIAASSSAISTSNDPLRSSLEGSQLGVGVAERVVEDDQDTNRLNNFYDDGVSSEAWEKVTRDAKEPSDTRLASDDEGVMQSSRLGPNQAISREDAKSAVLGAPHQPQSAVDAEPEVDTVRVDALSRESARDPVSPGKMSADTAPAVAPWSKAPAAGTTSNGLSLREIQRQELRNKAEEKSSATHEKEESSKALTASRWNHNGQPWGGAGDPMKQQTLSLREIEEEQKKKKASNVAREASTSVNSQSAATARPVGTKTIWASIAAKNSVPAVRRPTAATAVGKKTDDEAPFWDTVGAHPQATGGQTSRPGRVGVSRAAGAAPPQPQTNIQARPAASTPANTPAPAPRRGPTQSKQTKSESRQVAQTEENVVIGGRISHEFGNWCAENLRKLTGEKNPDMMLCEYLVTIPSPAEIKDTILQNLGANDNTRSFADEFVRRLEFERGSVVADAGSGGSTSKKRGRRHRAAKVDPSLVLGFTSTSSRIMQGTIETPEMK